MNFFTLPNPLVRSHREYAASFIVVTVNMDGLLTTEQAAKRLGIKVESVYTFARRLDGFPEPIRIGRTLLWPEGELDAWRAAHPARHRGST